MSCSKQTAQCCRSIFVGWVSHLVQCHWPPIGEQYEQ